MLIGALYHDPFLFFLDFVDRKNADSSKDSEGSLRGKILVIDKMPLENHIFFMNSVLKT